VLGIGSASSLHLRFLKTLEFRTDVSVMSTPPRGGERHNSLQSISHWGGTLPPIPPAVKAPSYADST
uniref:Uncharacterized protein n=1 Tax=Ornithorhynchus anatinus TaxID=9258 RepID=A0A6I8MZG1_ORNAN